MTMKRPELKKSQNSVLKTSLSALRNTASANYSKTGIHFKLILVVKLIYKKMISINKFQLTEAQKSPSQKNWATVETL